MLDEKDFWKSSYIWIRYFGYSCVHYDKDRQEVWLVNKKKQHVVIFKQGEYTTQSLEFDKDRILEHQQQINAFLSIDVKRYDIYFLTEKPFNQATLNVKEPILVKFHSIQDLKRLNKHISHPIAKGHLSKQDNHATDYFKKRVLNQSPIEKGMYTFTPATFSLIAVTVLIWVWARFFAPHHTDIEIIDLGALAHFNVVHGDWYRLISSMFLHLDIEHLLLNMMSLYIFGKLVESYTSSLKMLGIYFLSGFIGNILTLAFNTDSLSIGASGAIFGLLGALIALLMISQHYNRKTVFQLLVAAIIMAVISIFMRNVNIIAHLGGLLGGALAVYLGYYYGSFKKKFYWLIGVTVLIILILVVKIFMTPSENIYNQIIQDEMQKRHYTQAEEMIEQTISRNYADDMTYYLSGMVMAAQKSKAEAIAEWEHGLEMFPNSVQLNYVMAISNRSLGDQKTARKYIRKAAELSPQNESVKILKRELED
ncbi:MULTISPECIES: rhomboid family intramembrane serine protease [unclassified Staphylococcus]|uniref:rhomboid family protein n=1 Tax=unclassified Staphylococcus TaxID=91994 RepID=UPI0021D02BFB|nr:MULTISPECIES: rhomboid family intramembrane serine protease [unclassified Staphylococcus]UXR70727.1 rhomboid family intramembrane serine protease [Staphylococcus sp. IVB6240]UXR72957.1 rhomboid family intramembrane serine protease [Staphylococcus sp. IVB6238]UXR75253.1 rhomboid family intramembrane serine protease [Staphylococcus sp. IVB6233]UXR79453.1 rhomboid family intramembrane serine protease [Staphylococcus sp. IVB6218]